MPLILKLGYTNLLLPDDAPVATLLKVFQRAVEVDDLTYDRQDPRLLVEGQIRVEISNVAAGTRIVNKADGDEIEVPPPRAKASRPGTGLVASRRRRPARQAAFPLLEREP